MQKHGQFNSDEPAFSIVIHDRLTIIHIIPIS